LTSSQAHRHAPILRSKPDKRCLENVVPPSLFGSLLPKDRQARKDSAAYVSLSSYSLVKEHDGEPHRLATQLSLTGHADETFASVRTPSQLCIERTEGKPQSRLKAAPPSCGAYIGVGCLDCQHLVTKKALRFGHSRPFRGATGRPHWRPKLTAI
jgi:hypothetical protein